MNNKKSEKTDALLTEALEEYCRRENEKLPDDGELRAMFPPNEEDCRKYGESAERKARSSSAAARTLRRVAAIVLTVSLTAFALLMLNDGVRASVTGVVVKWFDGSTAIRFTNPDGEDETDGTVGVESVSVGYVPEGLALKEEKADEIRVIYLLNGSDDPHNTLPFVMIRIMPSDTFDLHFAPGSFDKFSLTTVNGKDAFFVDTASRLDEDYVKSMGGAGRIGGLIIFGDGNVTVDVAGNGLSIDELFRIAESVKW